MVDMSGLTGENEVLATFVHIQNIIICAYKLLQPHTVGLPQNSFKSFPINLEILTLLFMN